MTRYRKPEPDAVASGRAIANLLRFADDDLRDARWLMERGSLRNAAALQKAAVAHMVEATLASERGWPSGAGTAEAARIDDANPVKARLRALETISANRNPFAARWPADAGSG